MDEKEVEEMRVFLKKIKAIVENINSNPETIEDFSAAIEGLDALSGLNLIVYRYRLSHLMQEKEKEGKMWEVKLSPINQI